MAITTQQRAQVSQLYVALFGRAPDSEGLGYWVQQMSNGQSMTAVANAMYAVEPARAYYPSWMTNQEIIGSFYQNVLGRAADTEGLAYWTAKLNAAGASFGSVITDMIYNVVNYTGTNADGLASQALFVNKADVAQYYGEHNGTIAAATAILAGVTADPATVQTAKDALAAPGQTFTLTANPGATYTGTAGDDTFAVSNTIPAFVTINGAGGSNDTLSIVDTGTNWQGAFPATVTLSNVENISLQTTGTVGVATAGSQAAFDVSGITGLNALVVGASTGANYIKAATTTNVAVSDTAGAVMVNGGKDVAVSTTAGAVYVGYKSTGNPATIATDVASTGAVRLATTGNNAVGVYGGTTVTTSSAAGVTIAKAAGAVAVTNTGANNGNISIKGGTTVAVTNAGGSGTIDAGRDISGTRSDDVATDTAGKETFKAAFLADLPTGNVTIVNSDGAATPTYGTGATGVYTNGATTVSVTGGGSATIKDVNAIALAPATGVTAVAGTNTLTTVSLTKTGGASTVTSNALTNLTVADQSANVTVTAAAGARALNLTVNKLTGGTIQDAEATSLALTATGTASSGITVSTAKATSISVAGDKAVSFALAGTGASQAANLAITATNTAGVTIGTTLDNDVTFTGGAGDDVITIGATTKAITMGSGNNTVNAGATIDTGGSVNGGTGSADVLAMSAADAATASASIAAQAAFGDKITGFERLSLSSATNQTIDLARLNNIAYVTEAGDGNTLTINNLADNGTFVFTDASTATAVNVKDAGYNAANTLNVLITSSAAVNAGILQADAVETVKVTATDTDTTAHTDVLALRGDALKTITVAGNAALTLSHNTNGTTVTSVDASAITGAFGYTAPAFAAATAVTGSATAANTVTLTAAAAAVTYNGGAGADDVVIANTNSLANVINLGNGANSVKGSTAGNLSTAAAGNNTVNGGTGVDTIELGAGNNTVTTLGGNDVIKVGNGNNTINAGDGDDTITVGSGANLVTLGAGADQVILAAIPSNYNIYTTIADIAVGDSIDLSALTTVARANSALGAKVTLADTATFADYVNSAASTVISDAGASLMKWFQFGGNTYIVVDSTTAADTPDDNNVFKAGEDSVVKLTGLVDLSASTTASDVLTIVAVS